MGVGGRGLRLLEWFECRKHDKTSNDDRWHDQPDRFTAKASLTAERSERSRPQLGQCWRSRISSRCHDWSQVDDHRLKSPPTIDAGDCGHLRVGILLLVSTANRRTTQTDERRLVQRAGLVLPAAVWVLGLVSPPADGRTLQYRDVQPAPRGNCACRSKRSA